MKVEIWSDIVCPFCYIGKRRFEGALEKFEAYDKVEVVWRSFQLDPGMQYTEGQTLDTYLAKRKGVSVNEAREMNAYVTNAAAEAGVNFNLDKAVLNNTITAHRLLHLAKQHGVQNEVEEALFSAYFTQGENIGDTDTLIAIGTQAGLNAAEIAEVLQNNTYADEVANDIHQARQIGVQGVPFFVFNNKYAVSGAQATETFTQVLNKVWAEEKPVLLNGEGDFCTPDGDC
jgi:predicted DsbA family dithiol-disulfide isomerase